VLERGAQRRIEKADETKRSMAEWYIKNREHVLARCREYNAKPEVKHRERERQAQRYAELRDAIQAARRDYYEQNPEARERFHDYQQAFYRQNKSKFVARLNKRRATILRAMPPWADVRAIAEVYRQADEVTKATGVPHQVDHIVPLQGRTVCGLHIPWNLQVIPAKENQRKFNKLS
jgi:hypothetical protein